MAAFDPDAATAAYMATLSPAAHARATSYTQGGHWLLLWGTIVAIAAALLIQRSGLLARLSDRLQRRRQHPNLVVIACVCAFLLADFVLELPWAIYAQWWRERQYGLSGQAFGGWLGDTLLSLALSVVTAAVLMLAVYALIRRRPRSWWLWAGGVAITAIVLFIVVTPSLIEPLFNDYKAAPPGATRDAIVALARETGVPSDKILIYDGSRQSERYTANVSGIGGGARIAMSDTMFKQNADLAEVRGVVGHEMGHYVHGHIYWVAAVTSLLAVLAFFLIDRLYPSLAARIAGPDAPPIADPRGLPVVMALVVVLSLFATPVTNTLTRLIETDADRFSLDHAHEPDGLAKALVKTIAYRASSPSTIEEAVFYDHPSVERRVRRAMAWKAAHPGLVGDRSGGHGALTACRPGTCRTRPGSPRPSPPTGSAVPPAHRGSRPAP